MEAVLSQWAQPKSNDVSLLNLRSKYLAGCIVKKIGV